MTGRPLAFFDQEGIAELYDWRTHNYRDDFDLLARLAPANGGAVLDVACGAGRATRWLASQTRPVVGVDRSARMLQLAQARTTDLEPRPWFVQADVTALRLRAQFALITMVCNSFVDLVRPEDQLRGLQTLRDHLGPGGRLLIDITAPRSYERIDGRAIELPCPDLDASRRVECRLLSTRRSPHVRVEKISYRFYAGDRLERELHAEHERALVDHSQFLEIASRAGLVPIEIFGSYQCEPYVEGSPWQIYVLRASTFEDPRDRRT